MKKAKRWLLITATALFLLIVNEAEAALPFKKVALATTPASTTTTTTTTTTESAANEQATAEVEENKTDNAAANGKDSKLTGIPQIDYIWDPNLPRELRGYNLSSYPFLSTVPPEDEIHFKCDGLHDGFYASIEHKCQVYHHCVYGIRHDFLCANFTAFDQKTFICHFVSDVDCQGSQRYWNRNDELYMATTTTSTTTTTTEPPPTPARRRPAARPQRPLRRPYNRRPIDDYYYEDEEYEDDYYEERLNRRRKPRPRPRKPVVDYDEEDYDEKPISSVDDKPRRKHRYRDEEQDDEDYENERRASQPGGRQGKPTLADRRKIGGRKPAHADERRSFGDERPIGGRREKPKANSYIEDTDEPLVEQSPRRSVGRRRINEKRTTPSTAAAFDDLDDYEKPHAADQEEAAEEEAPQKVRTTPKPLEEFITPKAAPSSVYSRPRAPPRIARPVPVNEKKKYQYPVQKATATTATPLQAAGDEEDDYYQQPSEDEYDDTRSRSQARRRGVGDAVQEDIEPPARRRQLGEARKPTRVVLRKPVTDKKALIEADDYEDESTQAARTTSRRRTIVASRARTPATRANEDVDVVDVDYEERMPARPAHRLKSKPAPPRKSHPSKPRQQQIDEVNDSAAIEPERPARGRVNPANQPRRVKPLSQAQQGARLRPPLKTTPGLATDERLDVDEGEDAAGIAAQEDDDPIVPAAPSRTQTGRNAAAVRVVKRPFLPSRGGSPYLPRGLQPVGVAQKPLSALYDTRVNSISSPSSSTSSTTSTTTTTTDSTPVDMGSTISGVRLLEHGAPLLRDHGTVNVDDADGDDMDGDGDGDVDDDDDVVDNEHENVHVPPHALVSSVSLPPLQRTTLPPRSALPVSSVQKRPEPQPKVNLDELYENDYDVTLNDALDPTLKPLSPQHQHYNRNYASAYSPINPFAHINKTPAQQHYLQQQPPPPPQLQHRAYQPPQSHHQFQTPSSPALTSVVSLTAQQHQQQQQQPPHQPQHSNYNSDSYFSSTDIRRRAIVPAAQAAPRADRHDSRSGLSGIGARLAQHFYDDFEY